MAGKGSLRYDASGALGAVGATGTPGANITAREADLVINIGTRLSDFTTASKTAFRDPDVAFISINVSAFETKTFPAESATMPLGPSSKFP